MSRLGDYYPSEPPTDPIEVEDVICALDDLTPDQRVDVFHRFCIHCGAADPNCQCWNDE